MKNIWKKSENDKAEKEKENQEKGGREGLEE